MVPPGTPAAISGGDVGTATHIFAIGCTLREKARRSGKASDWSDIPDDKGYGPMRDVILRHVKNCWTRWRSADACECLENRTSQTPHAGNVAASFPRQTACTRRGRFAPVPNCAERLGPSRVRSHARRALRDRVVRALDAPSAVPLLATIGAT